MASETGAAGSAEPEAYDLVVIGGGPAGLAGAVTASELGLRVALLDLAERVGGQFYRQPAAALRAGRPEALHHDWDAFAVLRERLAAGGVTHLARHHVWAVERHDATAWTVHAVTGADGDEERPVRVRARAVLLATGAYERQLPFPGWTLPGVVGAGGAQAMLKAGLVLPGKRVVVAGSGPLLLAVASSLVTAGADVPAVIEAAGYLGYARRPGALVANPHKLAEAAVHGAALLRHRVALRTRSAVTAVHGAERVEAVTVARLDPRWRPVPGTEREIACDALAVGHGLVPAIDLGTTLGCATRRTPDGTLALALDRRQETSVRGVWAAGEPGGVGGAQLACVEGELAAMAIAARLGRHPGPGGRVRQLRNRRGRLRRFGEAMAAAHAPGPGWPDWLRDDTEVCRCEEVSAGGIREAVEEYGARDARTVKLLTRAGMGWCQGRTCGTAVSCLAGGAKPPAERRPLGAPVPLGALAALAPADGAARGGAAGGDGAGGSAGGSA
ncbi:NAD(P)/FAD-dependent oxidoreductase [Streptomyces sp. NBC_00083]|uniref:FAD/NAD(P)-dependent oxidoreductase n=1 Tax=Streptomyces sp. NBC_00083 TaxID=2975647 RepID=UPI0022554E56|nr:NAD(P)/FAD-dependent oxidoreductase [Streptomyces sp. NBC_00083]MCX5388190.1 FAD-dependent oxidoreductase [Streptomyces sp. NBC_00083]